MHINKTIAFNLKPEEVTFLQELRLFCQETDCAECPLWERCDRNFYLNDMCDMILDNQKIRLE